MMLTTAQLTNLTKQICQMSVLCDWFYTLQHSFDNVSPIVYAWTVAAQKATKGRKPIVTLIIAQLMSLAVIVTNKTRALLAMMCCKV